VTAAEHERRFALAVRTCALHPAGPLRTVAGIVADVRAGKLGPADADELVRRVLRQVEQLDDVPPDRVEVVEQFVAALTGWWK
jgi:hypothetical protein